MAERAHGAAAAIPAANGAAGADRRAAHGERERAGIRSGAAAHPVRSEGGASEGPSAAGLRPRFWERFPLEELTGAEWEALCDGCGRCCLRKIEYEDTGEVLYTSVACKLLDHESCRCALYDRRHEFVPDCVRLAPRNLPEVASWMPTSCAYRLLFEGRPLPEWHPLLSGTFESVVEAGISMRGKVVSEITVTDDDLEDYVIGELS